MLDSQTVRWLKNMTNAAGFILIYHLGCQSLCLSPVSFQSPRPSHYSFLSVSFTPFGSIWFYQHLMVKEVEQRLWRRRLSVRGKPVCWRPSVSQSVSCPRLSTVLQRFIPLRHVRTSTKAGADGVASCLLPSEPWVSCHDCSFPCPGGGQGAGGEVARLKQERATVPIFRPVNKVQKQMDLGAEIHLAPLEWLKPPIADLFSDARLESWNEKMNLALIRTRRKSIHIFQCS